MVLAPHELARRFRLQLHWDRIYVLTLVACFWIAAAEITYFLI
jgi:hypothetical protein